MRAPIATFIAGCLSASALTAASETVMSSDEWRRITEGKTVHYEIDGAPGGREYYPRGQSFAVFVRPDGSCVEGPWAHAEDRFCYWYGADFQCFYHIKRGKTLLSRPDTGGADLKIVKIEKSAPPRCEPS